MAAIVRVDGLNAVMRALRAFPPEAQAQLRDESAAIARNIMVPSFQAAARAVPSWGDALADSIRAKRDRLPAVQIGFKRRAYSGGASTVMMRYPTHSGQGRDSRAPFVATGWIDSGKAYKGAAMAAWGDALERVVHKWNRGGV